MINEQEVLEELLSGDLKKKKSFQAYKYTLFLIEKLGI